MGIEHEQEADVAKTDVWQLFMGLESKDNNQISNFNTLLLTFSFCVLG